MNRKQATVYARTLLDDNGLTDWRIEWRNLNDRQAAGETFWDGSKLIRFNIPFFANVDEERQLNTIKHEVAHAVAVTEVPTGVPTEAWVGVGGHNERWKHLAAGIGVRIDGVENLSPREVAAVIMSGQIPTPAVATFLNVPLEKLTHDSQYTDVGV